MPLRRRYLEFLDGGLDCIVIVFSLDDTEVLVLLTKLHTPTVHVPSQLQAPYGTDGGSPLITGARSLVGRDAARPPSDVDSIAMMRGCSDSQRQSAGMADGSPRLPDGNNVSGAPVVADTQPRPSRERPQTAQHVLASDLLVLVEYGFPGQGTRVSSQTLRRMPHLAQQFLSREKSCCLSVSRLDLKSERRLTMTIVGPG